MCMQCIVESVSYGEIVPGFYLHRAVKNDPEWPAGQLAIVIINNPSFYLEDLDNPVTNPVYGMSEEEQTAAISKQYDDFLNQISHMCYSLYGTITDCYQLYSSCQQHGWNPHEATIFEWLLQRIAVMVRDIEPQR